MAGDKKHSAQGAGSAAGDDPSKASPRAETLARMGHELRTPLNAIIGFIKLVEEGLYTTEEERRDYLASARQSALSLLDLINNILDLARIEAGRLSLESTELALAELVEEVARTLAPEAHAKGVEIDALVDPAIPASVRSDPVRLRQVLYNLAGNAVKFTESGLVLLRLELEAMEHESCRVRFSVRDTGVGVPEELRPVIFESFVQSQSAHGTRLGGVGLGLSIAKQIVEQMGSEIQFESRVNEGSTFWFSLLLPRGRAYGTRARVRGAGLDGARMLLVNPDSATAALTVDKLTLLEAHVKTVASTEAALALLAQTQVSERPVRVVLLDYHVRRDDALVFAPRVRRETGWYQPDLLHQSVIGAAGSVSGLRKAGFTGFVTKPATPEFLRGLLASLLERQGPNGAPLQAPVTGEAGAASPPRLRSGNVLVAEDNLVNQKLIHALLSKQGYATRIVGNGRDAVEALRHDRFDLVLMDVQMPVLDGLAAARAIRQLPHGRELPIIAMTADALDGDRERCLAAGMNDYVPKPIMPDVLNGKIRHWLEGGEGAPGAETPPPDPAQGEPVLNLAHLQAVQAYARDHDPRRFAAWVRLFRGEARAALDELAQAGARQDRGAAQAAAQRLALASGGFGAPRLLALARGAAERCADGDALEPLLPPLEAAYAGVAAELSERFGESSLP